MSVRSIVTFVDPAAVDRDPAAFSLAHDACCDLIVAGAVRHSPVHELIFGSVTGRVLDGDCDLPVLMSA